MNLLDTLPVAEFADAMRMPIETVRAVARSGIMNATANGVAPEEATRRVGVFMRAAIDAAKGNDQ